MDIWRQIRTWCSQKAVCLNIVKIVKSIGCLINQSSIPGAPALPDGCEEQMKWSIWNTQSCVCSLWKVSFEVLLQSCVVISQLAFVYLDEVMQWASPSSGEIVSNQRRLNSGITSSSFKDTNPTMRALPSWPHSKSNYLPNALSPNIIILGVRSSTCDHSVLKKGHEGISVQLVNHDRCIYKGELSEE